jgi:hypothetical protein
LRECLLWLGKKSESDMIRQRLDLAVARADVPIRSSCFCRLSSSNTSESAASLRKALHKATVQPVPD